MRKTILRAMATGGLAVLAGAAQSGPILDAILPAGSDTAWQREDTIDGTETYSNIEIDLPWADTTFQAGSLSLHLSKAESGAVILSAAVEDGYVVGNGFQFRAEAGEMEGSLDLLRGNRSDMVANLCIMFDSDMNLSLSDFRADVARPDLVANVSAETVGLDVAPESAGEGCTLSLRAAAETLLTLTPTHRIEQSGIQTRLTIPGNFRGLLRGNAIDAEWRIQAERQDVFLRAGEQVASIEGMEAALSMDSPSASPLVLALIKSRGMDPGAERDRYLWDAARAITSRFDLDVDEAMIRLANAIPVSRTLLFEEAGMSFMRMSGSARTVTEGGSGRARFSADINGVGDISGSMEMTSASVDPDNPSILSSIFPSVAGISFVSDGFEETFARITGTSPDALISAARSENETTRSSEERIATERALDGIQAFLSSSRDNDRAEAVVETRGRPSLSRALTAGSGNILGISALLKGDVIEE